MLLFQQCLCVFSAGCASSSRPSLLLMSEGKAKTVRSRRIETIVRVTHRLYRFSFSPPPLLPAE